MASQPDDGRLHALSAKGRHRFGKKMVARADGDPVEPVGNLLRCEHLKQREVGPIPA